MFKLVLEKTEEPEIKLSTSIGSTTTTNKQTKNQENSRKTFTSALLTMPKPLCGSQQTVGNSSRDENTRPPYLPLEKSVCRSRSNSLNPDMEQQTGSKVGKEYNNAIYCHPAYLNYKQSTS